MRQWQTTKELSADQWNLFENVQSKTYLFRTHFHALLSIKIERLNCGIRAKIQCVYHAETMSFDWVNCWNVEESHLTVENKCMCFCVLQKWFRPIIPCSCVLIKCSVWLQNNLLNSFNFIPNQMFVLSTVYIHLSFLGRKTANTLN